MGEQTNTHRGGVLRLWCFMPVPDTATEEEDNDFYAYVSAPSYEKAETIVLRDSTLDEVCGYEITERNQVGEDDVLIDWNPAYYLDGIDTSAGLEATVGAWFDARDLRRQTPGTADYMAEAERLGQMRIEVAP